MIGGARLVVGVLLVLLCPLPAHAATYRVGPGQPRRELTQLPALAPGDIVEVLGGATYQGGVVFDFDWDGAPDNPVIVRGIPDAMGRRPVIMGGTNGVEFRGDHYVVENLEVTASSFRCIYHHGHDITIRDTLVHHCPAHGILGADSDSGSLTLERVEVHHCGSGDSQHQIYMSTDQAAHPGSVFRMEHCYLHDATGGNNVKSRSERNEIYYNWIEGAYFHELELIGPDPGGAPADVFREDSDVVGNVLVKSGSNANFSVVRFGGDRTGETNGRYRFVSNTVVVANGSTAAVFRLFDGLESVEMHNNVFVARGGGGLNMLREVEASWVAGRAVAGSRNWVPMGASNVPPEWTGTIVGTSPGLVDVAMLDLRPAMMMSPVVNAGINVPPDFSGHPFPRPLPTPLSSPARRAPAEAPRPSDGMLDIGAYELGGAAPDAGMQVPDAGPRDAGMTIDAGRDGGALVMDAGAGDAGITDSGTASGDAGLHDAAAAPADAGPNDAAGPRDVGLIDGGSTDSGARSDASAAADALPSGDASPRADASRDGASAGDAGSSSSSAAGCGCRIGGGQPAPSGLALLAITLVLAVRRRRTREV